jgi:hypothetical protein
MVTRSDAGPVLVCTIPKAGTHLLEKVVRLLPGVEPAGIHIEQFVLLGGRSPALFREIPLADLAASVARIGPSRFATGHLLFSQPLADVLIDGGVRALFILRDPRDIAVSYSYYVGQLESHYLYDNYRDRDMSGRLMTTIVGIHDRPLCDSSPSLPWLMDIGAMVKSMLPWMRQPNVYSTSFERLVGPAGGGSRLAQLAEVQGIAAHVGVECSEELAGSIADQLFGTTATFRKGTIGDWRNHLTPEHIRAFKRVAGDLLIQLGYESGLEW